LISQSCTGCHTVAEPVFEFKKSFRGKWKLLYAFCGSAKAFDLLVATCHHTQKCSAHPPAEVARLTLPTRDCLRRKSLHTGGGACPERRSGKGHLQCPSVLRSRPQSTDSRGSEVKRTGRQLSCDCPDTCDEDGRTRCCWCWACGRRFIGKLHSHHAPAWTGHALQMPLPHMAPWQLVTLTD
jgi:hypothetical protein